ncbi:hypothetical protein [Streptococcus sp.]
MKNNAKTKISLVSILVILGVAARMMRVIHRHQIREQSKQTIRMDDFQKKLAEEERIKRNETFNKIFYESLARKNFENWQKVDELHGLGQRTGQFYIYNFKKKEEILLENTDQAFVLPIRDKSDNGVFQAIFAHKDGQWHIMKPDGSSKLQLGDANITAASKFVVEDGVLDYDQ